jgi:1,4-dihydroxy-2-naphthoyl-CoA hydrolase
MEINANHLRPVRSGWVTGVATPIHLGSSTQVWDIRITNDAGKLACIARLTLAVIDRPLA